MIRSLGLDRSPNAKRAAARLIDWMERYYHPDYATIGDALYSWLTADSGADVVAENWELFLKMVAASHRTRTAGRPQGQGPQWTRYEAGGFA